MRVLMLVPDPAVKGSMARLGAQLVDALSRLEVDVVVCRWGRHSDDESLPATICRRVADILHIRRLLSHGEFDVLFVNTAHDRRALGRDVPLLLATRGLARRRIVQFHGSLSNELSMPRRFAMKAASRWLVRTADAVLVLSSEEAREWRAFEPRGRFHVVTNTYMHKRALERPYIQSADWAGGQPPLILFVGRLIAAKGVFDLVDAVSRVQREGTPCRVAFAGDGEERASLAEFIRSKGVQDTTVLLGHLDGPELARAYRDADVFALPSYGEGFPTVLAEALDAGLPIVTTGIRGAVDHLVEERNALFVPPGRVDVLADALQRVLVDGDLRREMSAANREKVKDFAPSVVAAEYLDLLHTVLDEREGRSRP
jgi:glycosyltransferase involved in cell wall biosynthesis